MNSRKNLLILLFSVCFITFSRAQDPSDILFSVGDMDVTVSEFTYIYEKNNRDNISYDKDSVMAYLNLYKDFKLKVLAALDKKMDTLPSLKKELQGYKELISQSYLIDNEVVGKLAKEVFQRMQEDRKIAHIFIDINVDTSGAYEKAELAYQALQNGMDFNTAVARFSEDKNTVDKNGVIGYVSAPFNDGFYALENVVYALKVGETSGIVRTSAGYHIVKLLDIRPARGTMKIAQIYVAKPKGNNPAALKQAKEKIQAAYDALQSGESFADVVAEYSEDKAHIDNGGYIGTIAVNTFSKEFEDAAFSIAQDSAYSGIVETEVGFHIIQRLSAENPTKQKFADRKAELIHHIKNSGRYDIAINKLVNKVYREGQIQVNKSNLKAYTSKLDSSFLTYTWEPQDFKKTLITYKKTGLSFTGNDFNDYLRKHSRHRIRLKRLNDRNEAIQELFKEFKKETAIQYAEQKLPEKYPDYRHLMREYKEGILLFEITKQEVWDKAAKDTLGLMKYFQNHRDDYRWDKRAVILDYTFKDIPMDEVKGIVDYVKKHSSAEVVEKYGTDHVTYRSYNLEKGSSKDGFDWVQSYVYDVSKNKAKQVLSFKEVSEILPPERKTLEQSKGYVISDYQQVLENQWINKLKARYPFKLNKAVFRKLTH